MHVGNYVRVLDNLVEALQRAMDLHRGTIGTFVVAPSSWGISETSMALIGWTRASSCCYRLIDRFRVRPFHQAARVCSGRGGVGGLLGFASFKDPIATIILCVGD
jgi:hypothetical protein